MDAVRASFPPPPPQAPSPPSPQAPPSPQHLGVQPGVAAGLRTTGTGGRSGRLCPPVLSVRPRRLAGGGRLAWAGWILLRARRAERTGPLGSAGSDLAPIQCREDGPGAGPRPPAGSARRRPGAERTGLVPTRYHRPDRAWRRPGAERPDPVPARYRRPARGWRRRGAERLGDDRSCTDLP